MWPWPERKYTLADRSASRFPQVGKTHRLKQLHVLCRVILIFEAMPYLPVLLPHALFSLLRGFMRNVELRLRPLWRLLGLPWDTVEPGSLQMPVACMFTAQSIGCWLIGLAITIHHVQGCALA